jgi:hypothetical protein
MVATCAVSSRSIYITQMLAPRGDTVQLIVHQGDECWTLHARPEPVLHAFQWLKQRESVLEQIMSFGQWPAEAARDDFTLTVTHETLGNVRDLTEKGEVEAANELLLAEGNQPHVIRKLTDLLAQPHRVTVAQWVKLKLDQAIAIQSVTVLDRENELLVAVELAQTPEPAHKTVVIKAISLEDLKRVFSERLQG